MVDAFGSGRLYIVFSGYIDFSQCCSSITCFGTQYTVCGALILLINQKITSKIIESNIVENVAIIHIFFLFFLFSSSFVFNTTHKLIINTTNMIIISIQCIRRCIISKKARQVKTCHAEIYSSEFRSIQSSPITLDENKIITTNRVTKHAFNLLENFFMANIY